MITLWVFIGKRLHIVFISLKFNQKSNSQNNKLTFNYFPLPTTVTQLTLTKYPHCDAKLKSLPKMLAKECWKKAVW